jgi:hypothetical protein
VFRICDKDFAEKTGIAELSASRTDLLLPHEKEYLVISPAVTVLLL